MSKQPPSRSINDCVRIVALAASRFATMKKIEVRSIEAWGANADYRWIVVKFNPIVWGFSINADAIQLDPELSEERSRGLVYETIAKEFMSGTYRADPFAS